VTITKVGQQSFRSLNIPDIAEPHLSLLADGEAPHHLKAGRDIFSNSTLELRLDSRGDSQLVSFWEAPYFQAPLFPPVLTGDGWSTQPYEAAHAPRPDHVQFVKDALEGT